MRWFKKGPGTVIGTACKMARISKTAGGAKRRGIIMSVFPSLSKRLERFTLRNVLSEIERWLETGRSVFQEELAEFHHAAGPPCTVNPWLRYISASLSAQPT